MKTPTDYDHIVFGVYYKRGAHGFEYWWLNGEWVKINGNSKQLRRAGK